MIMGDVDSKEVVNSLYCLYLLESEVFGLYKSLSQKVDDPLVKSLFTYIAYDSLKHSIILKGISGNIGESEPKFVECKKKLATIWEDITSLSKQIANRERLDDQIISLTINNLVNFESSFSEEYLIIVQLKTYQFMAEEIYKLYDVNLENMKDVFELIIKDEENHKEILFTIKDLLSPKEEIVETHTPKVKYQRPDAWYTPST